jgi:hypothetical protein
VRETLRALDSLIDLFLLFSLQQVKLKVEIGDVLTDDLAISLELNTAEPALVSLDFMKG